MGKGQVAKLLRRLPGVDACEVAVSEQGRITWLNPGSAK